MESTDSKQEEIVS